MMVLSPCWCSMLCGAVLRLLLPLLLLCISKAILLSQTASAQECITPNVYPYAIKELLEKELSPRMFYQCYHATQQLQLTVNSLKFHGSAEIMVYTNFTPKAFNTDCGGCSNDECHMCDTVLTGYLFEIYLRVSSNTLCEPDDTEECKRNVPEYNMTFSLVDQIANCDDGHLVSFPVESENCIVNASSSNMIQQQCLVNTCPKENMSPDSTNEKIEHKFLPSVQPEFCFWELDTEHKKHILLQLSKHVKPHITIYEGTLSEPVRDLEWCSVFGNNQFQMETKVNKVLIVYNRQNNLDEKGSLSISLQGDLCSLPPAIEHGTVEFITQETGTKAFYYCDTGYELLGQTEITCTNEAWEEAPICLPTEKEGVWCTCVTWYLCVNNTIITDGAGIINIRNIPAVNVGICPETGDEPEICCGIPPSKMKTEEQSTLSPVSTTINSTEEIVSTSKVTTGPTLPPLGSHIGAENSASYFFDILLHQMYLVMIQFFVTSLLL